MSKGRRGGGGVHFHIKEKRESWETVRNGSQEWTSRSLAFLGENKSDMIETGTPIFT